MTDLRRHSKGFWRSIYIFKEVKAQLAVALSVCKELDEKGIEDFSYCHYGEVKSTDYRFSEEAHITFRINFPTNESYKEFLEYLGKRKWKYEDHNYDEPLWVKEAYVVGTKLAREIMKLMPEPDIPINANFFRLMLHGCFNDLSWDKRDEAELFHFLFDSMASSFGIGKKEMYEGKRNG